MTGDVMTHLIRITLDSAEIKHFNPDPAIHLWNKSGGRVKPDQKITKSRRDGEKNAAAIGVIEIDTADNHSSETECSNEEVDNTAVLEEPSASDSRHSEFQEF